MEIIVGCLLITSTIIIAIPSIILSIIEVFVIFSNQDTLNSAFYLLTSYRIILESFLKKNFNFLFKFLTLIKFNLEFNFIFLDFY